LINEKKWQNFIGKQGSVVKGSLVNGQIRYRFLSQPTLDNQIITALANKQFLLATDLFFMGLNLIYQLPSIVLRTYPALSLSGYLDLFQTAPLAHHHFVSPANLDIAPDNLIVSRRQTYYLDCEWVTDFPVEKNLLIYRYCLYALLRYQSLFLAYSRLKFCHFCYRGLLIPQDWFIRLFPPRGQLQLHSYFLKEENFQSRLHLFKSKEKYFSPNRLKLWPLTGRLKPFLS
jgi:hypothetical protein